MDPPRHTPGPWWFDEDNRTVRQGKGTGEQKERVYALTVCQVYGWKEDYKANARLIAAAPDLLAACKAAFGVLLTTEKDYPKETAMLFDAIVLAEEGRKPATEAHS